MRISRKDIGGIKLENKSNVITISKTLDKLFNAGFNTDKKILAMKMEDLEVLPNLSSSEIFIMIDDEMYGYKTFNNGLLFWKGNFLSRDTESFVEWTDLIYHIDAMILLNQLNDRIEPLKSLSEQMTLINDNEVQTVLDLDFTQEFVDSYLQNIHRDTKYLIYEEFNKSYSTESNINFLKNLYGLGGSTYTIKGSGIGEEHNAKGITFNRGYFEASATKQLFKWNYIEKRIKELIKEDRSKRK